MAVACILAGLLALVVFFDAVWWIVVPPALLTLPALWDFWRNPSAGVRLDEGQLHWHSGRREARLALPEIDHMRFDTRWDLSVRVTAVLQSKKRLRLPYESLPPHRVFEEALQSRGIRVERHHFTIF